MNKFHNKPQIVDGIRFASIKEAKRYGELKLLERAGKIMSLLCHPRYPLVVNGVKVCVYEADFCYFDRDSKPVVEDAKGVRTPVFKLKAKLMQAVLGITVVEV